MSYGSLKQDEAIRYFVAMDDDLDIIEFPKDCEGDIENQLKNISPSFVATQMVILFITTIIFEYCILLVIVH